MPYRILLIASFYALTAQGAWARTWRDTNGREFEATLIKMVGDTVFLNIGGRQRTFKVTHFSANDRIFLQSGGREEPKLTPTSNSNSTVSPQRRQALIPKTTTRSSGQIQANVSIPIERLRADPGEKRWVYGSPNFEFICDDDLGFAAIKKFAWMFESVWQFCEQMPFDIPRLRRGQGTRMKTFLVKDFQDYVRMGGTPRSAGVFIPSQDLILVPFRSLDLDPRAGVKDTNGTLRHEVTHQLMTGQSQQAGWFIEGSAEYVATVPFERTRLLTDRHMRSIIAYLTARGWTERQGHNLGKKITFSRLESFMQPDYSRFQQQPHAYAHALVLFTYFAKFDGRKDGANLASYVADLQDGRPEFEARKHLLAGRTYAQLEKDVATAWAANGITLRFE